MEVIPEKINEVLDTYFKSFESKLPNFLEDYYLYGSTSLGAFKEGFSDIDFFAVVNLKANNADVNILKEIHRDMQRKFPKTILDGLYVVKDDMESINENMNSLRFNDGKFYGFGKFDKNSIDAYQLKKYGITVKGQGIENLGYTVDWNILIHNMKDNLNTYWLDWKNDCKRFPSAKYIGLFVSLGMVEWGVLGVTRLFYTFKEKDITSKVGAGEYALRTVPHRWHKIIKESMRLRKGNKKSFYKSIFERRRDTLDYIDFIIEECNSLLNDSNNFHHKYFKKRIRQV